jgi:hypothetical protein
MLRRLTAALIGTIAAIAASGCATAPDTPDTQPRAIVAEPVTGSNIPRRDGKKGVAPVANVSVEQVKDVMNKPQVSTSRNGQP